MSRDLAILRGTRPNTVVAYADPPMSLRGSAKVATKFASIFFSDYDPVRDRGTDFMRRYRTGRIMTQARLEQEFAIAVAEILRQLGPQSDVDGSEALVRARLDAAEISQNREAYLRVRLITRNNEVAIQLPMGEAS